MEQYNKLSESNSFRAAIFIPFLAAIVTAIFIALCKDGSASLANFITSYKIPITIFSLSIPLTAWVVANHRSELTLKALKIQSEKRLYDMYYEQQKHFEKVIGRRFKNAQSKYIMEEDLPVIFSELYEFNRIREKAEISLKPTVIKEISSFVKETGEIIYDFVAKFTEHKEKHPNQKRMRDHYIQQLFEFLHNNLHQLSDEIGVKDLKITDTSIAIFAHAYLEVIWLSYYMGDDLKAIWDSPIENDGNSRNDNIFETFNAIESLVCNHMDIGSEATFENFHTGVTFRRRIIEDGNATTLQNLVSDFCHELLEALMIHFEFQDINEIEGEYSKYQFPARKELPTLELSFQEITPNEGDLILATPDTKYIARFIIGEKVKIDDEYKIPYSIDSDFRGNCFQALKLIFTNE
jgi:hypothetical protein